MLPVYEYESMVDNNTIILCLEGGRAVARNGSLWDKKIVQYSVKTANDAVFSRTR